MKKSNSAIKKPQEAKPPVPTVMAGLKSIVRIEIFGLNQARLINEFFGKVTLKNIVRSSNKTMRADIAKKDSQKAFALLEKMCYNYKVIGESGGKSLFLRSVAHVGLILSLVIFLSAGIVLSRMVWTIEVSGNDYVETQTIMNALKASGVKRGSFAGSVDRDKTVSLLRLIDGVAESTVQIKGTTVKIFILEKKDFLPPDNPLNPPDIISAYDAEITRIVTLRGTKTVNTGERVAKGETLIKGEIYNTNGEPLESVIAEGEVYGKVAFKESYVISATEMVKSRTGKTKKSTTLSLFSLKIGKDPKLNWEKNTSKYKLFFIPITVTRTNYYQTEITERDCDLPAQIEKLKAKTLIDNAIKAGDGDVECVTTLIKTEGDFYLLNIYVQAEILISVRG